MASHDPPATRLATRLAFFVAGFGVACWAPLVPFAKQRLALDDATLGLVLFCLGAGSLVSMQAAGALNVRHGTRSVIVASGLGLALILPFLATVSTAKALVVALFGFGAAIGSLDVAMNIHAVEVERAAGRPLMSGFHAQFSVGGFAGSTLMTFLLSSQLAPLPSTLFCAGIMLVLILIAWPRLLRGAQGEKGQLLAMPRGIVLLVSALAAASFLAEGAMLEWGALLITGAGLVSDARGGVGYMLFAIAMTAGRLTGDTVTARLGDRATLFWSGIVAVAGFVVLLTAPVAAFAMAGFLLIGLGASNIVPVLFRTAGAQTVMPPALAISALTTVGYAGVLVGPALIGFISDAIGLRSAFWMLAALFGIMPLTARFFASGLAGGER